MDIGENTARGNRYLAEKFVELLVVADGELDVPGYNPGLLVVTGGVARQL